MSFFTYKNGTLHVENVPLATIVQQFGTPTYVYSTAALTAFYRQFADAVQGQEVLLCYAMKANSNLAVLNHFAKLGAGFDIVSGGELERVIAAGGSPAKVVFSGVGKTVAEIRLALSHDILCFNVESAAELDRLAEIAHSMGKIARISLRVNPEVDPGTHPYISTGLKENKFGVPFDTALALYRKAATLPSLKVMGVDCHIGSQILDQAPLLEAMDKLLWLIDTLQAEGIAIHHLDLGGGVGIRYNTETPMDAGAYMRAVLGRLGGRKLSLMFELGRALVGNAGVLLTEVQYLKHAEAKNFCVVDAAMNDLIRPALYNAYHGVEPVTPRTGPSAAAPQTYDIVGPVCESGDWLAKARALNVVQGDLLCFMSAGAYGMVQSSNYNTRNRAAEVLVDGDKVHLVRQRETPQGQFALESVPV
jgi:diaminopimelate decarboxylase